MKYKKNYKTIGRDLSPLCFLPSGRLVCYRHGELLIIENRKVTKSFLVFKGRNERIFARCRYLYRLFRMGVRAAWAIDEENLVLSIGNTIYEFDLKSGLMSDGFSCEKGIRPLIFTQVEGVSSVDNGLYFGGYLGNEDKKPVSVYRRVGRDKWVVVFTFPQGAINHIHAIVHDIYRDCLWILRVILARLLQFGGFLIISTKLIVCVVTAKSIGDVWCLLFLRDCSMQRMRLLPMIIFI